MRPLMEDTLFDDRATLESLPPEDIAKLYVAVRQPTTADACANTALYLCSKLKADDWTDEALPF